MSKQQPKIIRAKAGPDHIVTATEAISKDIFFCLSCGHPLRVHKQRKITGPQAHFEHLIKRNCKLI